MNILNVKMASKSMIISNFVQNHYLLSTYYTICLSMVNTLNLVHDLDLTHLFKTISTHITFFAVEVLFVIQDGRHRKPEFDITLN